MRSAILAPAFQYACLARQGATCCVFPLLRRKDSSRASVLQPFIEPEFAPCVLGFLPKNRSLHPLIAGFRRGPFLGDHKVSHQTNASATLQSTSKNGRFRDSSKGNRETIPHLEKRSRTLFQPLRFVLRSISCKRV